MVFLLAPLVAVCAQEPSQPLTNAQHDAEIRELHQQLNQIAARLAVLEASTHDSTTGEVAAPSKTTHDAPAALPIVQTPAPNAVPATPQTAEVTQQDAETLHFFRGTTFTFGVDGYYGYNFNSPAGRVNLLRPYDVTSNSFNINQASIIVEHLPTPQERFGGRIDLMFGQATEAQQGSSANELRPQAWRNLYQAYGSYLVPIGSGLQLDFGKWASSLGSEGNYTKDQIAYSRSYSFSYLPFYHMGLRAIYTFSPRASMTYWLVNGINDTEDQNGFKSQGFLFALKPASSLTWNVNYYFGQEAPDVVASTTSQPGLPTGTIQPTPNGRTHIFDTYVTWNATPKLMLIGQADFGLNRTYQQEQPKHVAIGGLIARYSLPRNWNVGARVEYLDDRSGIFSQKIQALKEGTVIVDHLFAPGFIARAEYRRDFSNQPYFPTSKATVLTHAQDTATLGLIYWWGTKQGGW